MRKVLIVVDMQVDFISGILGSDCARAVIAPVKAKIEEYLREGQPVLFTMDTHEDEPNGFVEEAATVEAGRMPRHCVKGTEGWDIVPELAAYARNRVEKPSFMSLTLDRHIEDDITAIELAGVCTDICVISNALYLRSRYPDYRITVDPVCCAGTSKENHEAALDVMRCCLIDVL